MKGLCKLILFLNCPVKLANLFELKSPWEESSPKSRERENRSTCVIFLWRWSAVCFSNPWERRSDFVGVIRANYRKTPNVWITVSLVTSLFDRRQCCFKRRRNHKTSNKLNPRTFHLTAPQRERERERDSKIFLVYVLCCPPGAYT